MLQFVKQIKTLVHSKPTLYFGHLSCEETSQNELQPSGVDGERGCFCCVMKVGMLH